MLRLTRKEAAARLNVSTSTLDRMVKRGDLTTETEGHGLSHTVWVLMERESEDASEASTDNIADNAPDETEHGTDEADHIADDSDQPERDTVTENVALRTELKGLRELNDFYKERLTDSDWRYHELMEQFKTMTAALPAGKEEAPPPKRWWWPFR